VTLADGTQEKIGKIVNQKMPVEVLSYDSETDQIVPRKVVNWFKQWSGGEVSPVHRRQIGRQWQVPVRCYREPHDSFLGQLTRSPAISSPACRQRPEVRIMWFSVAANWDLPLPPDFGDGELEKPLRLTIVEPVDDLARDDLISFRIIGQHFNRHLLVDDLADLFLGTIGKRHSGRVIETSET